MEIYAPRASTFNIELVTGEKIEKKMAPHHVK